MRKCFLLLLDGMMGAGKTRTSSLLSEQLPRTAVVGMDKIKKFVSDFERGTRDNTIAREVVFEMTKKYLDLGLSVIVEHPFRSEEDIMAYEELANKHSIKCYKFQLFTNPDLAFKRINERQEKSKNKVPEERIKRNISLFKLKTEQDGFGVIDTTDKKPEEVAKIILNKINL